MNLKDMYLCLRNGIQIYDKLSDVAKSSWIFYKPMEEIERTINNVKEYFHHEFKPYVWATYINVFMTLANMVAVYCSFRYYSIEMRIYKYDNSVAPDLKFLKTHLRLGRVIEIFIEIFHPLSYIKGVNFMTHPYLYFFPLTRLLLLSRWFILRSSVYTSLMTEAIATLNHINFGTLSFENFRMIYRHYVHQYAVEITVISMIITWTLFAWLVRLAEARFGILTCLIGHPNVFYNYKDMLWLVPITMTTIGYGDIYPVSWFGRLVASGAHVTFSKYFYHAFIDTLTFFKSFHYNNNQNNSVDTIFYDIEFINSSLDLIVQKSI